MKLLIVLAVCATATLVQGGRTRAPTRTVFCDDTVNPNEHHVAVPRLPYPLYPLCDEICENLNVWEHGGAGLIWDFSSRECTEARWIYQPYPTLMVPCDSSAARECCCKFVEKCAPEEVYCGAGSTGNAPPFPVPREATDPLCDSVCSGLDLSFHPESTSQSQGTGQCTSFGAMWSMPGTACHVRT